MKKWRYLILLMVLILIFGTGVFFRKPWLNGLWHIFSLSSIVRENNDLKLEVIDWKNKYESLLDGYEAIVDSNLLTARVYSVYPFNTKNRIYANAGSDAGVYLGQTVLASKTIFVGQVVGLKEKQSEIITIFDPKFSIPVKIGKEEVGGLIQGGVSPKIVLIDKAKNVSSGDKIITSYKDVPFGLEIGKISEVKEDETRSFFEASVELSYQITDLSNVYFVIK